MRCRNLVDHYNVSVNKRVKTDSHLPDASNDAREAGADANHLKYTE